ncbi:MAG: dihydroorotase, partial [Clostridia bacterium]|nr:dihydroorotase [Clostridia bacterium]
TRAAARGGYRAVCSMPNLNPTPDTLENLKVQLDIIRRDAQVRVVPYGTITKGRTGGGVLADMEALAPFVCGFSDDGTGVQDEALMEAAMMEAKRLGKMIVAHCEDMSLIPKGGAIHEGSFAREHGIPGIPSASEYEPIRRDLELVRKTGCSYHVCHVSCKESVELIRQAKKEGLDVTCETGPHYLLLCQDDLKDEGCYKMNPPLRDKEDKAALIAGLLDGTIDMIATDHAPHAANEKDKGLRGSVMGIVGLETAFPLLYTHLVKAGIMSLEMLVDKMALAPARRFKMEAGAEKSFTVWDLEHCEAIDAEKFFTKGRSMPFGGWPVYGKCLMTVVDGKIVYREGVNK